MESVKTTHQVLVQTETAEPATAKQLVYIKALANMIGFHVSTNNMTKEEATKRIELLRRIRRMEYQQKNKDREVKLSMAKKLIYKKWIMQNKEINKQTEGLFVKEVCYLNNIFSKIDEIVFPEQAG